MLLQPQIFQHSEYGISYFGTQTTTVLPYYSGFIILIACLAYVSWLLWPIKGRWRFLRIVFALAAGVAGAIAATSYSQRPIWVALHYGVCALQLLLILVAAVCVLNRPGVGRIDYICALLIATDGAIIILTPSWQSWVGTYACREIALFLLSLLLLSRAALRAVAAQTNTLR